MQFSGSEIAANFNNKNESTFVPLRKTNVDHILSRSWLVSLVQTQPYKPPLQHFASDFPHPTGPGTANTAVVVPT